MRILIVHEIDWFKKVIFEPHHFAELFSIKGNEIYVIDCSDPSLKDLKDGFHTRIISNFNRIYQEASITIIRPPSLLIKGFNRITHFITYGRVLQKIIFQNKIDVILLYGAATNGIQTIKIAKKMNIPVVFRVLDIAYGLVKIPILHQLAKKHEKFVLKNAVKIFATTKDLASYAIEMGAPKEKVEYFPLGINSSDFKPMKKDLELSQNLGVSKNDKIIVFIGTIFDFSGLKEIILKFELLKNKIQNIKLIIVGGGSSFPQIQSIVKQKKLESDVILTGFRPQKDVPKFISLADLCINSFKVNYVTERILPTKILEYMACGKPVLSTPLRGTIELLPSEEFGIVYSTTEEFVENISKLLLDDKRLHELGQRGYAYVKNHHDWDVLSDKMINELKDLISDTK